MTPEFVQMLFALAFGFAVAGMSSSGYRLVTDRLPSFNQLSNGPAAATFAVVPLLVVAAPFLIMRNTILGQRQEGRRFEFVFLATLIAGFWSLMSGLVLVRPCRPCCSPRALPSKAGSGKCRASVGGRNAHLRARRIRRPNFRATANSM